MPLSPEQVDKYLLQLPAQTLPSQCSSKDTPQINSISPSLPKDFDHSLLPPNLCQYQLLRLSRCLVGYKAAFVKQCRWYQQQFAECKISRDSLISKAIVKWEEQKFKGYDQKNRSFYLQGLKFKRQRLQNQKLSLTSGTRMENMLREQIRQLAKRLKHLERLNAVLK